MVQLGTSSRHDTALGTRRKVNVKSRPNAGFRGLCVDVKGFKEVITIAVRRALNPLASK